MPAGHICLCPSAVLANGSQLTAHITAGVRDRAGNFPGDREGGRAHPEAAEGQAVPLEELAVLVRRVLQQHQDLALGGDAKALGELVLEDVERGVPGHLRKHVPPMRGAVRADG